jgi:hypothetical protein
VLLDFALTCVKHHQNEIAGARHIDDLFAATLALGGALDDAGQIQQLNLGVLVLERRRHAGCGRGSMRMKADGQVNGEQNKFLGHSLAE